MGLLAMPPIAAPWNFCSRSFFIAAVSAAVGAAAYAGISLTHRSHASAVAFVTGHEDPTKPESALDWESLSKVGTLCFYMGIKNLGRIASQLATTVSASSAAAKSTRSWSASPGAATRGSLSMTGHSAPTSSRAWRIGSWCNGS